MNEVDLCLFSGTGNTLLAAGRVTQTLRAGGVSVRLHRIEATDPGEVHPETLGLAFPVAAQSTYPFVWRWLERLPRAVGTPVFMLDTLAAFSGGIVRPLANLLMRKGYKPVGACEIVMPSNFLQRRLDEEKARSRREKGLEKADAFARALLDHSARWGGWPLLEYPFYWISRTPLAWRFTRRLLPLRVDQTRCIQCGLCARLCPVGNVTMATYPIVHDRCELCMRCFAYCPKQAIRLGKRAYARYHAVAARELLAPEAVEEPAD